MCSGDYSGPGYQPAPGYQHSGGCDQLLASQTLIPPASTELQYNGGQEPVIKTEAEHCGLETETEESGEDSEAEDRLKTEAEGGKEAGSSKPPFSYVAMIGETHWRHLGQLFE